MSELEKFKFLVILAEILAKLVQNVFWQLAITVSSGKDPCLTLVSSSYARLAPILVTRPCDRLQVQQHRFVSFDMLD